MYWELPEELDLDPEEDEEAQRKHRGRRRWRGWIAVEFVDVDVGVIGGGIIGVIINVGPYAALTGD
jgi:hypothetical protein